jgi:hypothetical protein
MIDQGNFSFSSLVLLKGGSGALDHSMERDGDIGQIHPFFGREAYLLENGMNR